MQKNNKLILIAGMAVLFVYACGDKKQAEAPAADTKSAAFKNVTTKSAAAFGNMSAKIASIPRVNFFAVKDPFYTALMQQSASMGGKSTKKVSGSIKPTQRFSIDRYALIGVMVDKFNKSAIFRDPEAKAWVVREGSPLGDEGAKIKRITPDGVYVEESFDDGSGKTKTAEKFISIKK